MLFFIPILLLANRIAKAQEIVHFAGDAKGTSLGMIEALLSGHSAAFGNQAGICNIEVPAVQLSYEYRWNNPELQFISFNGILPSTGGVFSIMVRHFGYETYKEHLTGLAFGKQILSNLSIAVQLDLIQKEIRGYGSRITPTFETGWILQMTESWTMGFHCFNPVGRHGPGLPLEIEWGFRFQPSDIMSFYVSLEKQTGYDVNQKIGFEYQHYENLFLRLGFSTLPGLITFGTGFRAFKNGFIDLASAAHLDLGFFTVITLKYEIRKGKS